MCGRIFYQRGNVRVIAFDATEDSLLAIGSIGNRRTIVRLFLPSPALGIGAGHAGCRLCRLKRWEGDRQLADFRQLPHQPRFTPPASASSSSTRFALQ